MHFYRKFAAIMLSAIVTLMLAAPLSVSAGTFTGANITPSSTPLRAAQADVQAEIVPGELIVKLKDSAQAQQRMAASSMQSSTALSFLDGIIKLPLQDGENIYDKIAELASDPDIDFVQPLYVYRALENQHTYTTHHQTVASSVYGPNDPLFSMQWGLDAINMDDAWQLVDEAKRANIVVAVLDTGVHKSHIDLKDQFYKDPHGNIIGANFVSDKSASDFSDGNGHGTHVAGIIGASADNNEGIVGGASGVKLMPVRVLNDDGLGNSVTVAAGIRFAVDNQADVINLSLGLEGPGVQDQLLEEAIDYALDHGVVVVAASGNESNNYVKGQRGDLEMDLEPGLTNDTVYKHPVNYPAAYEGVIGVGAVGWFDNGDDFIDVENELLLADFSNTGPGLNFTAPGVEIVSTYYNRVNVNDYAYASGSGTSMATPFVSALAALILAGDSYTYQLEGRARSETVQRILEEQAIDLGADGYDEQYGYGLVSAEGTLTKPRIVLDFSTANDDDLTILLSFVDRTGADVTAGGHNLKLTVKMHGANDTLHADNMAFDPNTNKYVRTYHDLTEPGIYQFIADDAGSSNDFIYGSLSLMRLPSAPTANIESGTYNGAQTVSLTSDTPGAVIYYTLNESEDPRNKQHLYTQPITISQSATLKVVSYKNNVFSAVRTYHYNIQAIMGGGGGGGGGGFFIVPPQADDDTTIETTTDGNKTTLTVTTDKERLLEQIASDSSDEIVIEAYSDQAADKVIIELAGEVIQALNNSNKPLVIQSNQVKFVLQPGTLNVTDPNAVFSLTAELQTPGSRHSSQLSPSLRLVSDIYEFNISTERGSSNIFNKPIKITIYARDGVHDRGKLGVYYFNERAHTWEYVGGYASADGSITFATSHFSSYAVLESSKTFQDIENHWAKRDIEVMAARQVAQGRDANHFDPNGKISRAEFAALLTRALAIPAANSDAPFTDVPADSWFYNAVRDAYAAGLIQGTSPATFAPGAPITREAMATMLMNAYAYAAQEELSGIILTQEQKYADEGHVSEWARRNVRLAHALGLMVGTSDLFKPHDQATRAEAISILKRLIDKLNAPN